MNALPASCVDQRRRDLAKQSFYEARKFGLANRAQLYRRRLLFEQAWLAVS
jgi:hypothetical protein